MAAREVAPSHIVGRGFNLMRVLRSFLGGVNALVIVARSNSPSPIVTVTTAPSGSFAPSRTITPSRTTPL